MGVFDESVRRYDGEVVDNVVADVQLDNVSSK